MHAINGGGPSVLHSCHAAIAYRRAPRKVIDCGCKTGAERNQKEADAADSRLPTSERSYEMIPAVTNTVHFAKRVALECIPELRNVPL